MSLIESVGLNPNSFSKEQKIKLDYVIRLFDNVLMDKEIQPELLNLVLNDLTEENSRDRVTLISLVKDDTLSGRNFELAASLGVEVLVNLMNYMNMRKRVQEAILSEG